MNQKKLFDKVIKVGKREYRYNSKECVLEWVSSIDYDWDSENLDKIKLDEPKVVDSIGLTKENAEADLMNYIERWNDELNETFAYEMSML